MGWKKREGKKIRFEILKGMEFLYKNLTVDTNKQIFKFQNVKMWTRQVTDFDCQIYKMQVE
jgi:hypothetical protein